MCSVPVIEFFVDNVKPEEFKGKRVLEVGSRYVNGSVRPFIESFLRPKEYIGVDIERGKFVDLVLPAERLLDYFGLGSFDVVISTATIEHIRDWRNAINNMKRVLKSNGYIYITTVGRGFPYHGYPYDFWRYELDDMRKIFSDFDIITLKRNIKHHTLIKAKKSVRKPVDLSNITLYSMIIGRRMLHIPNASDMPLNRRLVLRLSRSKLSSLLPNVLLSRLTRKTS